jgi:hypothetical protein
MFDVFVNQIKKFVLMIFKICRYIIVLKDERVHNMFEVIFFKESKMIGIRFSLN